MAKNTYFFAFRGGHVPHPNVFQRRPCPRPWKPWHQGASTWESWAGMPKAGLWPGPTRFFDWQRIGLIFSFHSPAFGSAGPCPECEAARPSLEYVRGRHVPSPKREKIRVFCHFLVKNHLKNAKNLGRAPPETPNPATALQIHDGFSLPYTDVKTKRFSFWLLHLYVLFDHVLV